MAEVPAKTAEERLAAVGQALDDYEKNASLPGLRSPGNEEELNEYFTMDKEKIESFSSAQCGVVSFRLAQYALYVQRLINREKSHKLWAEAMLKEQLVPYNDSYGQYTKHEMKIELAAKENSFIYKLKHMIRYAEQRIQRLDGLAFNIEFMSKVIMNMKYSKGKQNE